MDTPRNGGYHGLRGKGKVVRDSPRRPVLDLLTNRIERSAPRVEGFMNPTGSLASTEILPYHGYPSREGQGLRRPAPRQALRPKGKRM